MDFDDKVIFSSTIPIINRLITYHSAIPTQRNYANNNCTQEEEDDGASSSPKERESETQENDPFEVSTYEFLSQPINTPPKK
jgi:hypothetical protein